MITYLTPFVIGWAVVALVVCALAIYRKVVARHEDDFLHVRDSEAKLVAEQGEIANKLLLIDRWGKIMTVVALVYGLALAGSYVYASWVSNNAASAELQLIR
jgi:uncharacterized membrane protein